MNEALNLIIGLICGHDKLTDYKGFKSKDINF